MISTANVCNWSERWGKRYGALGKENERGKPNYSGATSPSATLSTIKPTWTILGKNQDLRHAVDKVCMWPSQHTLQQNVSKVSVCPNDRAWTAWCEVLACNTAHRYRASTPDWPTADMKLTQLGSYINVSITSIFIHPSLMMPLKAPKGI